MAESSPEFLAYDKALREYVHSFTKGGLARDYLTIFSYIPDDGDEMDEYCIASSNGTQLHSAMGLAHMAIEVVPQMYQSFGSHHHDHDDDE